LEVKVGEALHTMDGKSWLLAKNLTHSLALLGNIGHITLTLFPILSSNLTTILMYPNSSSMEITNFSFISSQYANILLFVTRTSTTKIHPTQLSSMALSIENPSTHHQNVFQCFRVNDPHLLYHAGLCLATLFQIVETSTLLCS
jgi:hypothetical protein